MRTLPRVRQEEIAYLISWYQSTLGPARQGGECEKLGVILDPLLQKGLVRKLGTRHLPQKCLLPRGRGEQIESLQEVVVAVGKISRIFPLVRVSIRRHGQKEGLLLPVAMVPSRTVTRGSFRRIDRGPVLGSKGGRRLHDDAAKASPTIGLVVQGRETVTVPHPSHVGGRNPFCRGGCFGSHPRQPQVRVPAHGFARVPCVQGRDAVVVETLEEGHMLLGGGDEIAREGCLYHAGS